MSSGSNYEVFAKITLLDGASPVLAAITRDILGVDKGVRNLEKTFNSLNKTSLAVGGAISFAIGAGVVMALDKATKHAEKLVHVQQQMIAAGMSQKEVAEATAASWAEASKYGLSVSEIAKDIKEARMVFGSTEHAINFIDPLEKMRVVLNSVTEGKGNSAADAVYEMARAGELKGLQTPEEFVKYFDAMTKSITASGGKVDPKAFFQATQYGRLASVGFNEEFYTKYLPSIIQEMRPSGAGTALMSLFNQGAMGKVGKRSTEDWIAAGLIGDKSKLLGADAGKLFGGWHYGAVKESNILTQNPFEWAQEVLRPVLEKKFGDKATAQNPEVIGFLGQLFGNRMAAQAIATLTLQTRRLTKDASLIEQAKGINAADDLLKHDPTAAMNKFHHAWENLLTALAGPLVEPKIAIINHISNAMDNFTKFALANPEAVKRAGEILASVGFGLMTLGGIATSAAVVMLAGPAGILAGVAAGLAAFGAFKNWDEIKAFGSHAIELGKGLIELAAANPHIQHVIDSLTKLYNVISDLGAPLGKLSSIAWEHIGPPLGVVVDVLGRLANLGLDVLAAGIDKVTTAIEWLKEKVGGFIGKFINYEGPGFGGAQFQNAAYHPGSSGGFGGSRDGLGGITSLSGSGGGRGGSGSGGSGGSIPNIGAVGHDSVYAMIDRAAGGNSRVASMMKAIFEGESNHHRGVYDANRSGEASFGPFQLNKHGGLGALFQRETGLDVADPRTIERQTKWVADYITGHRGPLSQWRGLAHGIERIRRGQVHPNDNVLNLPAIGDAALHGNALRHAFGHPHRRRSADADDDNAPLWPRHGESWDEFNWRQMKRYKVPKPGGLYPKGGEHEYANFVPPPPKSNDNNKQAHVYLDGRIVGQMIERHIVRGHRFAHSTADHDGRAGVPAVDYQSMG